MKEVFVTALLIVLGAGIYNYFAHPKMTKASGSDPRDAQIEQLKKEIDSLKNQTPKHHYELKTEGLRTWRFDPATGDICLELSGRADWSSKEAREQSCACEDVSARYWSMPTETDLQQKSAADFWNINVAPTCGFGKN